ncbi:PREDICTED: scopoletin glucosyltransferase-like [Populus euphratica]|uniref:Glycosyltransferase n=1 Tax=Populus euphratica TaxID=75702 RepID=A0AAJ6SWA7_POPEU|nr:PREDICTED: scopoletin glucosyltransferase-like [Populus euphratica]
MDSKPCQLHVLFLPYMAPGHMIPTIDMARLFARRGVKATIISTPLNAPFFSKAIERDGQLGHDISIRIIKFPAAEAGLPEGCENLSSIKSWDMHANFFKAMSMLQQPIEQLLEECHPHCLVADMTFTWATEVADKLRIPRLYFNGTSYFAMCVFDSLKRYEPHRRVDSDFEPFIVPGLPDQIKTTRQQVPDYLKQTTEHEFTKFVNQVSESEVRSYGVLVNSFHELEPAYSEHYTKVMGRKAWHLGPLSLCNRNIEDKAERGNTASIGKHECLRWLDLKKPNSVLYICFGSLFDFPAAQLREIALALEDSGQNFIWVVRKHEDKEEWLPEGFERRMEGKGLIIRGWAPQVLILDHKAVGGFMTHCGWNSTLEAVTAGVPLVTWPLYAEQFDNEKLITDVLKIGIGVGALEWSRYAKKILVRKDDIEKAIVQLMAGEEAEEIRNRARELQEMARNAMEEGGSSYSDLTALLEELRALETSKQESAVH